ncbi:MAG TPA: sterol desaturase family protein [Ramlibacter sp.]|jgi:beta-carotene 3-hydroxylase|nr:sterol desaturase family protein [Ramlibacter sp.]
MHSFVWFLVAVAAFFAMEGVAWLAHRYVMHGFGWRWHRSHHEPRRGLLEANDGFSVIGASIGVGLFLLAGAFASPALQAAAVGVSTYGVVYWLVHDGLVHQRWPFRWVPRAGYLRRLVQAHRLHHAVRTREGALSFGFLLVPDPHRLAERLRARRRASCS